MDWGGFESKLKSRGVIKDTPKMYPDSREVWEAFLSLSTARIVTNNGVQPITYSEILAWTTIHDIDGDTREEFTYIIRMLDRAYLAKLKAKNAQK